MKKFSFALDKVLSYKRQYEESVRSEHAAILHKVMQQEEKIARLWEKDGETRREMDEVKKAGCMILQIRTYESYLDYLQKEIANAQRILDALRVREEEKRQELIKAKTDTKSIDKLKEKKLEEYRYEEAKEQEQLVEEFVNHELSVAR